MSTSGVPTSSKNNSQYSFPSNSSNNTPPLFSQQSLIHDILKTNTPNLDPLSSLNFSAKLSSESLGGFPLFVSSVHGFPRSQFSSLNSNVQPSENAEIVDKNLMTDEVLSPPSSPDVTSQSAPELTSLQHLELGKDFLKNSNFEKAESHFFTVFQEKTSDMIKAEAAKYLGILATIRKDYSVAENYFYIVSSLFVSNLNCPMELSLSCVRFAILNELKSAAPVAKLFCKLACFFHVNSDDSEIRGLTPLLVKEDSIPKGLNEYSANGDALFTELLKIKTDSIVAYFEKAEEIARTYFEKYTPIDSKSCK